MKIRIAAPSARRKVVAATRPERQHGCSSATELMTLRRTARRCGAFVLVAEDQSPLFQIIRRHFDRDAISGKGFDSILFHSSSGVGDELMPVVELNPITGVRQYLHDQSIELQQFFFCQVMCLVNEWSNAALVDRG
jgi:hypothetical protein